MEELRLLDYEQVCNKIGFHKSWLFAAVKEERFPKPIRIAGSGKKKKSIRWLESTVDDWIKKVSGVE
jgi:predicted DNA-binding transcriptional regulator AlpA